MSKRARVLVVEDHEPTAFLIKAAFDNKSEDVAWDLCFATDGQEALDCLFGKVTHGQPDLPDLVLLDWNLPKVNGADVLRLLKSSEELRAIPVLVFSSCQEDDVVDEAYKSHANGYIPKPCDLDDFYAVVESIKTFWVHTARLPSKTKNLRAASGLSS